MKGRKSWSKPYRARRASGSGGYTLDARMKRLEAQINELIGWKHGQEMLARIRAEQQARLAQQRATRPIRPRRYWR